jgi:hypothetical protein
VTLFVQTTGVAVGATAPALSDGPRRHARRDSDRWSRWADEEEQVGREVA